MSDLTVKEQHTSVEANKIYQNAIHLSNIIELSTSVMVNIAGKDVADTLQKQSVSRSILSNLIANRIKAKLFNKEI